MRRLGPILLGAVAVVVIAGPFLTGDPIAQSLAHALAGPGDGYALGADQLGRSVLARVVHGGARSLGLAIACVAVAAALGVAVGLLAAWSRGWVEVALMRLADLVMAFPGLLLALLLAGFLGGGTFPVLLGLTLTQWPGYARLIRAQAAARLVDTDIEAARLAGLPGGHVLSRLVLPPLLGPVLSLATLGVGGAVLSISALGFLGLGLQPPTPEWGAMIGEALPYLAEAPLLALAPAAMLFASVLGLNLIGDTLADRWGRR